MIDRAGRDALAVQLRRLASGRLTNAEFDSVRLDRAEDEALVAIGDAGWSLYDDVFVYRLRGRRALKRESLDAVARCVLFLDTNLAYEWPARRPSIKSLLFTLVTLGRWLKRDRQRWEALGPYHVWPFYRESDYHNALANPRRLTGKSREDAA
jgi:hypothetical protein